MPGRPRIARAPLPWRLLALVRWRARAASVPCVALPQAWTAPLVWARSAPLALARSARTSRVASGNSALFGAASRIAARSRSDAANHDAARSRRAPVLRAAARCTAARASRARCKPAGSVSGECCTAARGFLSRWQSAATSSARRSRAAMMGVAFRSRVAARASARRRPKLRRCRGRFTASIGTGGDSRLRSLTTATPAQKPAGQAEILQMAQLTLRPPAAGAHAPAARGSRPQNAGTRV